MTVAMAVTVVGVETVITMVIVVTTVTMRKIVFKIKI